MKDAHLCISLENYAHSMCRLNIKSAIKMTENGSNFDKTTEKFVKNPRNCNCFYRLHCEISIQDFTVLPKISNGVIQVSTECRCSNKIRV